MNTPTPMRGPGYSTAAFPLESAIDELAHELGIDPIDLRQRNEPSNDQANGRPFSTRRLSECYTVGAREFGWDRRNPKPASTRDGDWLIGVGVATAVYDTLRAPAQARVRLESWPLEQHNVARYVFLHPTARDLFADWEVVTAGCVARLRALAGVEPDAADLTRLVDELLIKSPDFAQLWERYEVRSFTLATKTLNHPDVGKLTLSVQGMQIEGTPGHRLVTYYAEPGTPDHDTMVMLDHIADEQTPRR